MQQVTLNVQGMTCGSCANKVEGRVGKLTGVESVKIHAAIKDTGYEVTA